MTLLTAEATAASWVKSAVEVQRDVGVVGAARLEPPGQRRGDHRHLVAQRGVVVLDDLVSSHSTMPTSLKGTMRWGLSCG